ncbi:MAG: hypothetical protein ACK47B_22680 [Armatimonadota bacterium]
MELIKALGGVAVLTVCLAVPAAIGMVNPLGGLILAGLALLMWNRLVRFGPELMQGGVRLAANILILAIAAASGVALLLR